MMRQSVIVICVLIVLVSAQTNTEAVPSLPNNFLVEAKVIIDSKAYNPTNMSLHINSTTTPFYTFNLSAQNFNKNVTVALRLFSWYNGQWMLSRQTVSLKITDRRNAYRVRSHLMAALLKYNSRKYQAQMTSENEPTLLNYTQIIVSYDPESSLMVSRLEDPELFTPQTNYYPLADMNKEAKSKPLTINITFTIAARSDAFISTKNHIVSLNEVAGKIKQRIPLIARPIGDNIEPILLYKSLLFNYDSVKRATKLYNQKTNSIQSKKYGGLLLPRLHRLPFALPPSIYQSAAKINITLTDNFIPTFYFILQQGFILDHINQLQDSLRKGFENIFDPNTDLFGLINLWAEKEVLISFIIGALWVLLDICGYLTISTHPGLSWSFGYFLIVWLIPQIISLSLRVGSSIHQYWGVGCFVISLILLKLITTPLQNRFNSHPHKYSAFDKGMTEVCFNLLMMALLANGISHLFVDKDITNGELAIWAMSEFELLLSEYYYFLAMLPPFFLIFKAKSAGHLRFVRLLLFLIIALKDDYWILIDTHWALVLLRLKEQILFFLIILLKIIYGNRPIQFIKPETEAISSEESPSQAKIEESKKDE